MNTMSKRLLPLAAALALSLGMSVAQASGASTAGSAGTASMTGGPVPAAQPSPPKASAARARPVMFAAASVAGARKMSTEQREERQFLKQAAAASRFESEASRMALAKSTNAGVRAFAATLINHHASTGMALQYMLHGRSMAPPMLANDQRKTLNRLAKLGGARFDREYMEQVGRRYQRKDLQTYEKAALTTRDPALRAWIAQTLPTLRYHLVIVGRIGPAAAKPPKPIAPRASLVVQAGTRQPATRPKVRVASQIASQPELATQFMGAGPMQLGATQPVAAWPSEPNSR